MKALSIRQPHAEAVVRGMIVNTVEDQASVAPETDHS